MNSAVRRIKATLDRLLPPPRKGPVAAVRLSNQHAWQSGRDAAHRPQQLPMEVVRKVSETRDTVSLWLRSQSGSLPQVQPGQFFTCSVADESGGAPLRRAYSLSCLPNAQGELRITVKKLPAGRVSGYLHEQLQIGDSVQLSGPSGDFVLPEPLPKRLVMIAAGSGITPIRSLIEAALQQQPTLPIDLYYGCRNRSQVIFYDELTALAAAHPHFRVHLWLSKPGKHWQGGRGRMNAAWCAEQLAPLAQGSDCHFYLCGPDGLMQAAQSCLVEQGVSAEQIHCERFLAAPAEQQAHPRSPQRVRFVSSGVEVMARPGQTLLEAGLAAGVDLGYSCQVGGCGHCRVKLHAGETVSDQPNCLSDQEYAQGYRLACLSYACNTVEIDA